MIHKVTLPKLGETVETSTIERWRKKEGDAVATGDILCDITTDKATLEVESYHRGTILRILAPEKKELAVGTLIAIIGEPGEAIPDAILAEAGIASAPRVAKAASGADAEGAEAAGADVGAAAGTAAGAIAAGGKITASPRARKLAAELGVVLGGVKGTGPAGRIVEADVQAAAAAAADVKASPVARKLASQRGIDLAAVEGGGAGGKVMKEDVLRAAIGGPGTAASIAATQTPAAAGEIVPLTPMRRIIAERMLESKRTTPCYYLEMDADVTDMVALRNELNAKPAGGPPQQTEPQEASQAKQARRRQGKISFNDFVLRACGMALKAFPIVNSRWVEGRGVQRRTDVNIGFAVALDDGLIVPVVRDVDRKSLREISAAAADLTDRARTRKLKPDEFQGGCMSVTNLGIYGVRSFIPIVNPGESTILGLGMVQDRVVFWRGNIVVRKVMALTLAVDHRLVDGAVGAQFVEMIKDLLETPQKLTD